MVNQDLGRVAVVLRGEYDPAAEYERLDCVSYQGSSYLVRKHCTGVTPAAGEYYQLAALAGSSAAADAAAEVANEAAENAEAAAGRADTAAGNAQAAADAVSGEVSQIKDDLSAEQTAREEADNALRADLTANASADAVTKRSLDALWKLNQGISYQFETDDTEAYIKTVPAGARLASVESIGGHTEAIDGELVSAEVMAVVEYGRNLFNAERPDIPNTYFDPSGNFIGNANTDTYGPFSIGTDGLTVIFADGNVQIFDNSIRIGLFKDKVFSRRIEAKVAYKRTFYPSDADEMYIFFQRNIMPVITVANGVCSDFIPYREKSIPIPPDIPALPGYGWSAGDVCNAIERTGDGWQYVQRVGSRSYQDGDTVTDGVTTYYVLDNPVIMDITNLMNGLLDAIPVEAGGTLTFENAAKMPVPSSVEYAVKLSEVNG